MPLATGSHAFGPDNASLLVKTYREGVAARAGHDLVIEVTRWDATVTIEPAGSSVRLSADASSLEVREGLGGVKPLTQSDRRDIRHTIDEKVLGGQPITFRSHSVRAEDGDLLVEGELTLAGATRPISARVAVDEAGRVHATIALTQSDWGIKPYRGMLGALKVRNSVEVVLGPPLA